MSADPPETSPNIPLGRAVGAGISWTAGSGALARLAAFIAQLVLASLLTRDDFGVYALTIGFASLLTSMQDGGIRELLVQRGAAEYESLRGPASSMALAINGAIGLALLLAAQPVAEFYGEPEVRLILPVLALATLCNTPFMTLMANLRINMRFRAFASVNAFDAVARSLGAVAFALAGFGPLSFVLALPIVNILDWVLLRTLTGERITGYRPDLRRWSGLFASVKWLTLAGLFAGLLRFADYAVLGRLVPASVLGVYFFAFQLVGQSASLLSTSLIAVLLPALTRIRSEAPRRRRAILSSLRVLMMAAAPLCIGAALVFDPFEELVWGGKWQAAVVPFVLFSLAFPFRLTVSISRSSLLADGRFRAQVGMLAAAGAGLALCAAVVGSATDDVDIIAAAVAAYLAVSSIAALSWSLRDVGVSLWELAKAITPAWLLCLGAAVPPALLDRVALANQGPVVRIVVLGAAFFGLAGAGLRIFLADDLVETLTRMPARASRRAAAVFFLTVDDGPTGSTRARPPSGGLRDE